MSDQAKQSTSSEAAPKSSQDEATTKARRARRREKRRKKQSSRTETSSNKKQSTPKSAKSSHNQKAQSKSNLRDAVWWFNIFFSMAWIGILVAYGVGYVGFIGEMGGRVSAGQGLVFISLVLAPLLAVWLPYALIKPVLEDASQELTREESALREVKSELGEIKAYISKVETTQNQLVADLIPFFGAKASQQIRARSGNETTADLNLPLVSQQGQNTKLLLSDLAHVLNFSDRDAKGDWANAFARLSKHELYLAFIRLAEDVIEGFEDEGIYVEDLSFRTASPEIWREFIKGERGEAVAEISGVRDPSILALIRARLRNDSEFQDLSLRFQKQFMKALEDYEESASDEDLIEINRSRGGRVFVILANLSGLVS